MHPALRGGRSPGGPRVHPRPGSTGCRPGRPVSPAAVGVGEAEPERAPSRISFKTIPERRTVGAERKVGGPAWGHPGACEGSSQQCPQKGLQVGLDSGLALELPPSLWPLGGTGHTTVLGVEGPWAAPGFPDPGVRRPGANSAQGSWRVCRPLPAKGVSHRVRRSVVERQREPVPEDCGVSLPGLRPEAHAAAGHGRPPSPGRGPEHRHS